MQITWKGEVVAKSEQTQEVGGYRYYPREAVRMDLLKIAPKTESDRACPHGVQFYDVVKGETRAERAAWSYEKPKTAMKNVDHWIGFWEDGEIE